MKYAIVSMKDSQNNSVEGIGVLSTCGTVIVAATARKGNGREIPAGNGTMANLTFADIVVAGFHITKDAEDEGYVEGVMGTEIIKTPYYQKQFRNADGSLNPVMHSTIFDYQFLQNLPGKKDLDKKVSEITKQFKKVSDMFGPEFEPMYIAAVTKAHEHLNSLDLEGKATRSGNSKFALAANYGTQMAARNAEKRRNQPQESCVPAEQNADEGSVTAGDAIPD